MMAPGDFVRLNARSSTSARCSIQTAPAVVAAPSTSNTVATADPPSSVPRVRAATIGSEAIATVIVGKRWTVSRLVSHRGVGICS